MILRPFQSPFLPNSRIDWPGSTRTRVILSLRVLMGWPRTPKGMLYSMASGFGS